MPSLPLLAGRYRLESQIAAGGVGEVWRGEDTLLTRPVAIKLLRAEYAAQTETLVRFRAEARHAGALSHPAIARVFDYGDPVPPNPAFLVMELVDGPSLAAILAAGPIGAAQTMDVVAQVASGLQAAHASALVHRDIKPANLLITRAGQVKITDFGIAHVAGSVPVTRTGIVMGTPAYLAPERVSGASATPATDLYSLGVVAYECLAGTAPFTGKPLQVAAAHRDLPLPPFPHAVPAEVAMLVAELTAKDPAARPASAREVAARAGRLREGVGGAAASWLYPVPATSQMSTFGWRPERSRRAGRSRRQPAGRAPRIAAIASVAAGVAALAVLAVIMMPGPARHSASAAGPAVQASQPPAAGPSPSVTRSPPPKASRPPAPATVEVAAASLVGQPVDQVTQQLQQLGLTVRVKQHLSQQKSGTVLAVMPAGQVRKASTVVVTVAFMFDQNPRHDHHHHRDGGGGQTFPAGVTVAGTAAPTGGG